ncbi:MAG: hypothetical protein ACR2QI_00075 [Woeseiaceae bacterium]
MVAPLDSKVLDVADVGLDALVSLLQRYKLELVLQNDGEPIIGSFWGQSEAGIVGKKVYVRGDTPIHSFLHESCHIICMTRDRREQLDRDAGGDDLEEAGVCYLQIVLADWIRDVGRQRLMKDMDAWGYSFRLGSTREWFERDAEDAREFLINQRLLTEQGQPTFTLRS